MGMKLGFLDWVKYQHKLFEIIDFFKETLGIKKTKGRGHDFPKTSCNSFIKVRYPS